MEAELNYKNEQSMNEPIGTFDLEPLDNKLLMRLEHYFKNAI